MTASPAGQPQRLPPGWKWAKLGEIARINPPRAPHIPPSPGMSTTFVPMASVSEDSGTIAWPETRTWSEVSKGYTYFEEGDVLFAKITPCMQNGKHAIASGLTNGFGAPRNFTWSGPGNRSLPTGCTGSCASRRFWQRQLDTFEAQSANSGYLKSS